MDRRILPHLSKKDAKRFWGKIDIRGDDDCWEWMAGKLKDGYGHFFFAGHHIQAQRVAYALGTGIEPDDLYVLHQCDNPPCCNYHHLYRGDAKTNARDMVAKGRFVHNGVRGELVGSAKLTSDQVMEIRSHYASGGYSLTQLGRMYGICFQSIHSIVRRKTWRHI